MSDGIDWREMFKRYARIVGEEEGVWFLHKEGWTLEEWTAIEQITEELRGETP